MTQDPFPYVSPPPKWKGSVVIEHERGTRQYLERGTRQAFAYWCEELHEWLPGDLIPLSWVPEYVGVTRAAVRQRVKANRLTVFSYIFEEQKTLVGKLINTKETRKRFDYAAISECQAWMDDIIERMDLELEQEPRKHKRRK